MLIFDGCNVVVRDEKIAYETVKVGVVHMHQSKVKCFHQRFANVFDGRVIRVVPRNEICQYVTGKTKVFSGVICNENDYNTLMLAM